MPWQLWKRWRQREKTRKILKRLERPHYKLDPAKLRVGDVILSTEPALESWFIRFGTRSRFSHAAIYLGNAQYAEAVGIGVRQRALSTIMKEVIKVIRLKDDAVSDAGEVTRRAVDYVNEFLHQPYWVQGALAAQFRFVPLKKRRSLFCSHLVATVYESAGLKLFGDYDPIKITPARLDRSDKFKDVTSETRVRVEAPPRYLLDSDYKTLGDEETTCVQGVYSQLVPLFRKHRLVVPDDWQQMQRDMAQLDDRVVQRELDREMVSAMKQNGYLSFVMRGRQETIEPLKEFLGSGQYNNWPKAALTEELQSKRQNIVALEADIASHQENASIYQDGHQRTGLETFRILTEWYIGHINNKRELIALMKSAIPDLERRVASKRTETRAEASGTPGRYRDAGM